jgi:tellurite resistance protein TerC
MTRMTPISVPMWAWGLFAGVVIASLATDLIQHRGDHGGSRRAALTWSGIWIGVSLVFGGWVHFQFGRHASHAFLTSWLVEKSLSIDNLFVFLLIFRRLKIPYAEQHRVLFWGILGAFVTRAAFIAAGSAILTRWHFASWVLAAFLLYTGQKTLRTNEKDEADEESKILDWLRTHLRVSRGRHGHAFLARSRGSLPTGASGTGFARAHSFAHENGRWVATPLLVALVAIELSDIMFAVDSIPAVFAITSQPFIVFTSNVFAILGLRALYLVIADVVADLKYLHLGLGTLLLFVGVKMMVGQFVHIPAFISLLVTIAILAGAIVPSLVVRHRHAH